MNKKNQKRDNICPKCAGELVIRSGTLGLFKTCVNYPDCDFIHVLKLPFDGHIVKTLNDQKCPICQDNLALRQGKYSMFIGCTNYPDCGHTESTNRYNETKIACPQCKQGQLLRRTSRFGKIFHACNCYPNCQFVINYKPIMGTCAYCQYPLLLEKHMTHGVYRYCASKICGERVI